MVRILIIDEDSFVPWTFTNYQATVQNNFSSGGPHKFLTFALAGEEYGLSIMKIKEIIGMMSVTVLPQTPDYVKGVINLRGKVIPIIDLRCKFNLEQVEPSERTCIIVYKYSFAGQIYWDTLFQSRLYQHLSAEEMFEYLLPRVVQFRDVIVTIIYDEFKEPEKSLDLLSKSISGFKRWTFLRGWL